ncbi:hypothetical protein BDZ89DRAFT_1036359 [Hymenopellis radicata]|nr:hypothetical protein BDZ89DRAFT_1036359 [Hymenopellis radicata]
MQRKGSPKLPDSKRAKIYLSATQLEGNMGGERSDRLTVETDLVLVDHREVGELTANDYRAKAWDDEDELLDPRLSDKLKRSSRASYIQSRVNNPFNGSIIDDENYRAFQPQKQHETTKMSRRNVRPCSVSPLSGLGCAMPVAVGELVSWATSSSSRSVVFVQVSVLRSGGGGVVGTKVLQASSGNTDRGHTARGQAIVVDDLKLGR